MKNLKSSLQYIFRNFGMVLLFTLIPSLFLGSFYNMHGLTYFLANYRSTKITGIASMFELLFDFSFTTTLFFVLTSIMLIVFVAGYVGSIENHFRMGKPNTKSTSYYINNNALAVLTYFMFFVLFMIVYKLILTVLLFTSHVIFSGLNFAPNILTFIFALVIILVTFSAVAFLLNYLMLGLPITLYNGYSIRTSLSEASELLNKRHLTTTVGLAIPLAVFVTLLSLGKSFMFPWVANVLAIWGGVMFVPVYAYVCYFAYSGMDRNDKQVHIIKH